MTTPSWSTMWMPSTASQWRVICLRGPAMPLRRGIGTQTQFNRNTFVIKFYDNDLLHYSALILYSEGQALSSKR